MNQKTSQTARSLIPVTILTGFLGSGKTTLLNHLVTQPELADALVIINEFGEMPLDHMMVAHSTENLIMEMSSGCVCCNIRGDLVQTLQDITARFSHDGQQRFRRVLIETTGLADPAPIIHTLMSHPQIGRRYRLDGIVTTVDMTTGMHTFDQHKEAVKQAALADTLLLTKTDLVTREQHDALLDRLDSINQSAPRWEVNNGEIAAQKVLDLGLFTAKGKIPDVQRWLNEEAFFIAHTHDHHHDANRHDDHIRAFCFTVDEPIPDQTLRGWIELLTDFVGSHILRVKGVLNVEGQTKPIVVHGVQHIFYPPASLPAWPDEDRRSRLVFITYGVDKEQIEKMLNALRPV